MSTRRRVLVDVVSDKRITLKCVSSCVCEDVDLIPLAHGTLQWQANVNTSIHDFWDEENAKLD